MTTPTDTPRTDAQYENNTSDYQRRLVSEDLERKLAAEIANRKKCCRDGNQISDELFDTQLKLKASQDINSFLDTEFRIACKRAEKAEEELAEIKETYASIVQQPHFDEREVHCSCVPALREEVERLNRELAAWDYGTRAEREQEARKKAEAEVERLKILLSDLLILTEKNYWNSTNYKQIKEAINTTNK
jgi:phosphopentomutase